jgi:EAL domain-containing protein (putative c-di-GMP-specific phosphodiesterase class I)
MSPDSEAEFETLDAILVGEQLYPRFQPIVHLHRRAIHGYEGLIRGPSDSPLHSPARLFGAAVRHGRLLELDYLARRLVIRQYARLRLPGRLFINISPEVLMSPGYTSGLTQSYLEDCGLAPDRVVLEITETQPVADYELIRAAVEHYREAGFAIAIDDLGAGYSGLKLWSEMAPDFVKIDRHFLSGIDGDRVKYQFVRSILEISHALGCQVIAEGVETAAEYAVVRRLGAGPGLPFRQALHGTAAGRRSRLVSQRRGSPYPGSQRRRRLPAQAHGQRDHRRHRGGGRGGIPPGSRRPEPRGAARRCAGGCIAAHRVHEYLRVPLRP